MDRGDILIYTNQEGQAKINVRLEGGMAWLAQKSMGELFSTTRQTISYHLNNIFKEGELGEKPVVKVSLTTAPDGKN